MKRNPKPLIAGHVLWTVCGSGQPLSYYRKSVLVGQFYLYELVILKLINKQ